MILKALPAGPLMTNCYIVGDESTGEAGVFDPSGDVPTILKILEDNHLKCVVIVNTHTHFDHIGGNAELKEATGAPLVLHPEEVPGLEQASSRSRMFGLESENSPGADRLVKEGDTIAIGNLTGRVVEMRGHSPCGIAIIFENEKVVISGDALFAGSVGRADLEGGDMQAQVRDIREKLLVLDDETVVCPGHGPTTTVGREKRFNPYF
ncbi:MAG: MBL fold metallo-hydrolase [Deltaproteobacteria bacterium]|nr:MBL fold metallo-hydrolase [Deltaproteobacteria bacterium]